MTDVIVIGGGPAGLSAAINVRARGKSCVVIGNRPAENPLWRAQQVDNYPGMRGVSGAEMLSRMRREAEEAGVTCAEERVIALSSMGDSFLAATEQQMIEGRRAILAVGAALAKPMAGERELLGCGVSYCATCDGMLYRGKRAIVTGNAPELPEEAAFLQRIGVEVTVITRRTVTLSEGLSSLTAKEMRIVEREGKVAAFVADGTEYPCEAVFILRPMLAPDTLVRGLAVQDGFIAVDKHMQTNIPGLYAAGDCTGKPLQIAKAVGEGLIAAQHAAEE